MNITVMASEPAVLHDVVALLVDVPEHGIRRGDVGTIVEFLGDDAFEVEFCDADGQTNAQLALARDAFLVLRGLSKARASAASVGPSASAPACIEYARRLVGHERVEPLVIKPSSA